MASLSLRHICKTYENGFHAVKDFNLEIKDKEFIVLIGPSGCGKSTILRMIAGLEEITQGQLFIGQEEVNVLPPKERDVAMLFQNCTLYPDLTVYENMVLALKRNKVSKEQIAEQVQKVAELLSLEDLLKKKPKALSEMQRQSVAIGRAIAKNPKLYLMDEPLSNLDERMKEQMWTKLQNLYQKMQKTIIYVTNDQREAMAFGTRIVVMKDGVIQQADTPGHIYERPQNKFVAGFLGTPAMNFIEVLVEEQGEELYFDLVGKKIKVPAEKAKKLAEGGYIGKKVTMGIRPGDICNTPAVFVENKEDVIEGKVRSFECAGSEQYLYMDVNKTLFTIKMTPDMKVKTGDRVTFAIDSSKMYAFDLETEKTIFY